MGWFGPRRLRGPNSLSVESRAPLPAEPAADSGRTQAVVRAVQVILVGGLRVPKDAELVGAGPLSAGAAGACAGVIKNWSLSPVNRYTPHDCTFAAGCPRCSSRGHPGDHRVVIGTATAADSASTTDEIAAEHHVVDAGDRADRTVRG